MDDDEASLMCKHDPDVGDYFFNGCWPLPREISRVRIKFEIGIRVLEAEVIEFEIVFQSFPPSLLSTGLSVIYFE